VGQGFAPMPQIGGTNTPPVLGRNPNTYFNYMSLQDSQRLAQAAQNSPQNNQFSHQNLAGISPQPPYNQLPSVNPYMPQQMPTGLASIPGAAQFGKGIV
jgi:hypothetical protein